MELPLKSRTTLKEILAPSILPSEMATSVASPPRPAGKVTVPVNLVPSALSLAVICGAGGGVAGAALVSPPAGPPNPPPPPPRRPPRAGAAQVQVPVISAAWAATVPSTKAAQTPNRIRDARVLRCIFII